MPRIIGIDPGIRRTGYGVIDTDGTRFHLVDAGVIKPPVDLPLVERLLRIERALEIVIAEHRPDSCGVENVFYHKNPRSMLTLGQAQSAAMLTAARNGLAVETYSPTEVKQAVTGGGRAAKEQVCFMVERILGRDFSGSPDDMTDALAVAICHAGRTERTVAGGVR